MAEQSVRDPAFFFLLARIVVKCPAASEIESATKPGLCLLKGLRIAADRQVIHWVPATG